VTLPLPSLDSGVWGGRRGPGARVPLVDATVVRYWRFMQAPGGARAVLR
jgi:hypothetical protein